MADLAIGLSKKVVDGLVKKVDGAIKEEQQLWQTVERDSVFIKDEFEMMKSFLKTADRDRVRNSVVRTWVRQVRDLSYDAEDCIDGVLDLEQKGPWWNFSFLPYTLSTLYRPKLRVGRDLNGAVDKIKLIKARVEEVSQRNLRYNLINTTGSSQQMQQTATAVDMDVAKVQEGFFRLRCLLEYEGCQRRVISVWGTGGSLDGSITIIRSVFDDPTVCQGSKYRAWVKLMHPFSPQKFLGDLVAQLLTNSGATCGTDVWSTTEASSVLKLAKEVEQVVKGSSYLIVLEDLSNIVEWDTIRTYLPDQGNGSRVIVSTQHRELARLCAGVQPQYQQELSQLSSDHSVYAFFKEIRMPSQHNQGRTNPTSLSVAANYWSQSHCLPVFGRDKQLDNLMLMISSEERHNVVTVLGPPNTAKDFVVAKVCLLLMTPTRSMNARSDRSFELYGWVDVSEPFDVLGFCESLLSVMEMETSHNPVSGCSHLLNRFRCLVVINGLKCPEDCLALASNGLIYDHPKSCILIVTAEESVATYWTKATSADPSKKVTSSVFNMEPIPHEFLSGQQGQLPTPRSIDEEHITRLFYMSNSLFLKYASSFVGREEEAVQLSSVISSSGRYDSSRVVVVQAPPGFGKTALVEKVYSQFVVDQQFDRFGWVQVSDPFNLVGFCRSLLSVLQPQSLCSPGPDPIWECSTLVRDHPCLIVIDGLQCVDNFWELARAGFIQGHAHGRIVLITTEKSVTTTCMASLAPRTGALFQVKALDRSHADCLFRKVCRLSTGILNDDRELVVDKCCGIPIVILAVAKYLNGGVSKDAVQQLTAVVKDGKFIQDLATYPQPEFVALKGLLDWVDSDLRACPESLKLLSLYMYNFSQETVVRRKRLVWRWIAEGYIQNTGICDMVTEAEEHIKKLEYLTMMMMTLAPQPQAEGRRMNWHRGYQLTGLSGEFIMAGAAEDQLFLPLELSALTQGKKRSLRSSRSGCAGRHLRIDGNWEGDEFVFRGLDLSRIRSLTVSGKFQAFFISDSMSVLRVLDLEDATDVEYSHLETIPKLLPRLRFLSVRRCRKIDRLPDSIGDLRQLQTLDIRRTMITKLPNSILKLRKLQCLRAGHTMKAETIGDPHTPAAGRWRRMSSRLRGLASCPTREEHMVSYAASKGVTIPRGMSQLADLHTLGIVNVNTADGEAILEELQHFKQLRKVELFGINSCNVRGLRHLLPCQLDSLSLEFTNFATSSNPDIACLPSTTRIKLHGHVGILQVLPYDTIKNITDLTLEIDTSLTEENMKLIGKLLMLRTLHLHFHGGGQNQEVGNLRFHADYGFHELEVLEITTTSLGCQNPLSVEFDRGAAKSLVVLKLAGSLFINTNGLQCMDFLKEVWVDDVHGSSPSLWVQIKKAKHRNNPAIISYKSWQFLRKPLTEFVHIVDAGWFPSSSTMQ